MVKTPRSAKQKAATKKLVAANKRASRPKKKRVLTKKTVRRKTVAKKKGSKRRKKYVTISISRLIKYTMQYSNLTGQDPWDQADRLLGALIDGGDVGEAFISEVVGTVRGTADSIRSRPFETVAYAIGIEWIYSTIMGFVGRKQIWKVGKYRVTT
jgi:hypothetical protein